MTRPEDGAFNQWRIFYGTLYIVQHKIRLMNSVRAGGQIYTLDTASRHKNLKMNTQNTACRTISMA